MKRQEFRVKTRLALSFTRYERACVFNSLLQGVNELIKGIVALNISLLEGKYKPEGSVDPISVCQRPF